MESVSPARQWESKFALMSPSVKMPEMVVAEDAPKVKRGRAKGWEPKVLTRVHLDKQEEFMQKYGSSSTARERVLTDYQEFCRINGLDPKKGLAPVIGQMLIPGENAEGKVLKGLGAGSIDTYSGFVYAEYKSASNLKARRAAMRYHADADCEGAARFSRAHLLQTLLKIEDVQIRRMCLILWLTGLRPIAVRRLRRKLFAVGKRGGTAAVTVQIRWDKTGQKRVQRRHLQLPWTMVDPIGENGLRTLMGTGDPEECPYADITCDMINAALYKVAEVGENITSYCFRKAYVSWIFELFKGDMPKVKEFTLHFSDQVVKAHYVDWFAATAQTDTTAAPIDDGVDLEGEVTGI